MKFATLGPAGSNHDLNTRRYIEFHGIEPASIVYVTSFFDAVDRMVSGEIDFTIQVCAHPDVAATIERHYAQIFLVDCFIGKTKNMGVITRTDVEKPTSIGYMVATAGYFEPNAWSRQTLTLSNADTAARLIAGEFDSGFTALEVAEKYPEKFRIDKRIGEVDVVWLVYGRKQTNEGKLLAWREAPVGKLF